jgi:hypothetical protein
MSENAKLRRALDAETHHSLELMKLLKLWLDWMAEHCADKLPTEDAPTDELRNQHKIVQNAFNASLSAKRVAGQRSRGI